MNEKISMIEIRNGLEVMKGIIPILNKNELVEMMLFSKRVIERYTKENYLDGLPEE